MTKLECFVSIIAPVRNDSKIIEDFIVKTVNELQLNFQNYELVLIDDGSQDDSVATIRGLLSCYPGIRMVQLSRSFGEEVAIAAGLELVIGDFAVVMLPFMDPPNLIRPIVECSLAGNDIVLGVNSGPRLERGLYRVGSKLFHAYCRRVLGITLPKKSTQFRCLSRRALNAVIQSKDIYRYLRFFSYYSGYKHEIFPYVTAVHGHRRQPRSLLTGINSAIDFVVENSTHPLRFVTWTGIAAACLNLIYVIGVGIIYTNRRFDTNGWASLSLQSSSQFLFLTVMLTIMSEYVGRILERLRDRPFYYVMDESVSSVLLVEKGRYNIVSEGAEAPAIDQSNRTAK